MLVCMFNAPKYDISQPGKSDPGRISIAEGGEWTSVTLVWP